MSTTQPRRSTRQPKPFGRNDVYMNRLHQRHGKHKTKSPNWQIPGVSFHGAPMKKWDRTGSRYKFLNHLTASLRPSFEYNKPASAMEEQDDDWNIGLGIRQQNGKYATQIIMTTPSTVFVSFSPEEKERMQNKYPRSRTFTINEITFISLTVTTNGNCWYESIKALFLCHPILSHISNIRKYVIRYFKPPDRFALIKGVIECSKPEYQGPDHKMISYTSAKQYYDYHSRNCAWADETMIFLCSLCFRCWFVVMSDTERGLIPTTQFELIKSLPPEMQLNITHRMHNAPSYRIAHVGFKKGTPHINNHYEPLIPMD